MSFWNELRRRNVFKAGTAYLVVAWVIAQVVVLVIEPLSLPEWFDTAVIVLLAAGFPIALVLAWAYDLTPAGIRPERSSAGADAKPRPPMQMRYVVVGIALAALTGAGAYAVFHRDTDGRWARTQGIPEVERLADAGDWESAYALARQIEAIVPGEPALADQWPRFSWLTSIPSNPPGAAVYRRAYGAGDDRWEALGQAPLENVRVPFGLSELRFELAGYRPSHTTLGGELLGPKVLFGSEGNVTNVAPREVELTLDSAAPAGMVRVPGWTETIDGTEVRLDGYWLGRYEVTNREYKAFVDAGGYERREFWEHAFVRDGETIAWEDAMSLLTDRTGRPGPSTWEVGDYAEGQDDHPVAGVSWYEAAAFARFAGAELPTVYHWRRGVARGTAAWTLAAGNFSGVGSAAVGSSRALDWSGAYDMVGNVREWVYNAVGDRRFILGGGWNDERYVGLDFGYSQPALDRSAANGFRLAITRDEAVTLARGPLPERIPQDIGAEVPASDEVFAAYRRMYDYDAAPLDALIEESLPERGWVRELVSFDAPYDGERMLLYLYLPQSGTLPFQTVLYWPGATALFVDSIDQEEFQLDFMLKSGRAVAMPVFAQTYQRGLPGVPQAPPGSAALRDLTIKWIKDLRRSIDYLETRNDIDSTRLAYYGRSWGGANAPIALALEPRFRAAVLYSAGILRDDPLLIQGGPSQPEIYPVTFLPRVEIPVLLLSGEFDNLMDWQSSVQPFFSLLGTPEGLKKHFTARGGHFVPREDHIRETLDWLDLHLGRVE